MAGRKKTPARGKRKAKMGRPAIPTDQLRRNRILVTLTDAELAMLQRFAEKKELALGTAIHDVLVRSLKRRK